jgi:hypothetical protein
MPAVQPLDVILSRDKRVLSDRRLSVVIPWPDEHEYASYEPRMALDHRLWLGGKKKIKVVGLATGIVYRRGIDITRITSEIFYDSDGGWWTRDYYVMRPARWMQLAPTILPPFLDLISAQRSLVGSDQEVGGI